MIHLPAPLILASASPRRKTILKQAGFDFEVIPSSYQEPRHSDLLKDPQSFAEEVALGKAREVFRDHQESIVLGADTLGIIGDQVLEKPTDRDEAREMLQLMSGKAHQVLTSYALYIPKKVNPVVDSVFTTVFFRRLTAEEIEDYLDEANWQDKAAAYAIQGRASLFVERIEGDYFNVVGLPVCRVVQQLQKQLNP